MHPVSHNPKSNKLKYAAGAALLVAGAIVVSFLFDENSPQKPFHSKKPLVSDVICKKPKDAVKPTEQKEAPEAQVIVPESEPLPELIIRHVPKPEKKIEPKDPPKPLTRSDKMLALLKSRFNLESLDCEISGEDAAEKPGSKTILSDDISEQKAATNLMLDNNDASSREDFEKLVDDATIENDLESIVSSLDYLLSLNILSEGESETLESAYFNYLSIAAKNKAGLSELSVDEECLRRNFDAFKHFEYLAMGLADIYSTTGDSEGILAKFPKEQHSLIVSLLLNNAILQISTDPEGFQKLFISLSDENKELFLKQVSFFQKSYKLIEGRDILIMKLVAVTTDETLKNRLMEIMMNSSSN